MTAPPRNEMAVTVKRCAQIASVPRTVNDSPVNGTLFTVMSWTFAGTK